MNDLFIYHKVHKYDEWRLSGSKYDQPIEVTHPTMTKLHDL